MSWHRTAQTATGFQGVGEGRRLNGWQRLWVLTSALLGLAVLVVGCLAWPTVAEVSESDVYKRMPADSASKLYLSTDPNFGLAIEAPVGGKASLEPPVGGTLGDPPIGAIPDASVEGHSLHFVPSSPGKAYDVPTVVSDYKVALANAITARRASTVAWLGGLWVALSAGLYALGWAIAWVWRGFRNPA